MVKFDNLLRMILDKKNNYWLRIAYTKTYRNPITFLKFIDCEFDSTDNNFLVLFKI